MTKINFVKKKISQIFSLDIILSLLYYCVYHAYLQYTPVKKSKNPKGLKKYTKYQKNKEIFEYIRNGSNCKAYFSSKRKIKKDFNKRNLSILYLHI